MLAMALAWAIEEDVERGDAPRAAPPSVPRSGSVHPVDAAARQPIEPAPRSLSVLVADDEGPLRSSLSTILESAGHRVAEAEDGEVALRRLQEGDIDVLVLDLYMPKTDGLAILRRIEVPPPIVIVYSAFSYFSLSDLRQEVGVKVFRFMQKPVPPIELIAAVNEAAAELDR